ncbi:MULTISPECIES: hypothetical protein [Nostoc]|uniref:Uncharacterized protein n=1 Tax=Nostoc paludosum FACHB-159 TaxID=2692908 RepID=A0ABR8KQ70_9NOSO|nr:MULTISPECIES: hypothetical protein [Nostoc]MBD2683483.1 hypothetical protein [Nostoc sp. FACHB-857]MBD2739807.1 hypothetical protein [Nostoc paludosum FACHB-159]
MKLYLTSASSNLPPWATITSTTPDLIELEINDNHPDFQSLINGLTSEIQPGVIGVKSADLCEALVDRCEATNFVFV